MRKTLIVFSLLLAFVGNVSAQTIIVKPVLPEGYRQWPNVFMRKLVLDENNTMTYTVWVRKFANGGRYLSVTEEINGVVIITTYSTSEYATFLFIGDGYVRLDKEVGKDFQEARAKFEGAVQKKFDLSPTVFERIDFFTHSFHKDLERFFERCVVEDRP
ncbi:MAG: hypothetical protein Q7S32_00400 [bacterium]|nr:hypothetical protein [bacterium]